MKRVLALFVIATFVFIPLAPVAQAGFSGTDLILPTIGRVDGVGGSHFYTTIWITNPSADAADFEIAFLRAGQSNPTPQTFHDSIAAGATKSYENAAESLFGTASGSRWYNSRRSKPPQQESASDE